MDKNGFWSVDKLLPGINSSSSFAFKKKNQGVLIQNLHPDESEIKFDPPIFPTLSRVIRFYQFTKVTDPQHDALVKNCGKEQTCAPPFVSCGLFSPTLLSLNDSQREYFFYFCQCVEKRKKISISFPYLQLYICRCIRLHLVDLTIPEEFFWTWIQYRKEFPLADKLFCDTISDFCLLAKTEPPYEKLSEIFTRSDYRTRTFLLERYLFDYLFHENHVLTLDECNLTLRFLTGESFRKSKAYRMHPIFATAAEDAVITAMKSGLFNKKELNDAIFRIQIPSEVRVERALFPGLPKGEIPRTTISLCYVPLLNDENIRSRFDEIIRYLENRIRKILKMKNSLSRIHISAEHQSFTEAILLGYEHLAPSEEIENKEAASQELQPKHEARKLEINFDDASKIEEESWLLTQKLTASYTEEAGDHVVIGEETEDERFDLEYQSEFDLLSSVKRTESSGDFWEFASTLTETEDSFMRIALHAGKDQARTFCMANGCFFEALIASCNAKAQETIEDSIFDGAGAPYDDYVTSLKEVFPPMEG